MSNDYNCVSIGNFNPSDGDQILISKDLLNPVSWGDYVPRWSKSAKDGIRQLSFTSIPAYADTQTYWSTDVNVTYDDAGKLMLNINGTDSNCGPMPFPGNGQLAAFIDVTGPWANSLSQKDISIFDPSSDYYYIAPIDEIDSRLIGPYVDSAIASDGSQKKLTIHAPGWNLSIRINEVKALDNSDSSSEAQQIDFNNPYVSGSVIQGGNGNNQLFGKAGWDILDGGKGNDLIRAGNGRDILTGGLGADELHGDFGWNTYKSEKDGFSDLIA
ncbi:MAG: calcium-binding protein, partial [Betaproteobacteria bacterium]|nr:calcium-binding protein [Betaproteobacteria bacterium]